MGKQTLDRIRPKRRWGLQIASTKAAALSYDQTFMPAPEVTACGEKEIAKQMQQTARRYGVPVVRDCALAELLQEVEPCGPIPEKLFEPVARIFVRLRT